MLAEIDPGVRVLRNHLRGSISELDTISLNSSKSNKFSSNEAATNSNLSLLSSSDEG